MESLTWLPGGDELAYAISTPRSDESIDRRIEAVDIGSGRTRRLLANGDTVSLLVGGTQLIVNVSEFREGQPLERPVLIDLASGKVTELTGFNLSLVYIGSFSPSPDGRRIAFGGAYPGVVAPHSNAPRGMAAPLATHPVLQDVWVVDTDGNNLRSVADLAANQPSIAWSPDSRFIYAMTSIGFWRVDPLTATHRKIGPGLPTGRIKLLPGH
jgi:Tol biopolymer transport system component